MSPLRSIAAIAACSVVAACGHADPLQDDAAAVAGAGGAASSASPTGAGGSGGQGGAACVPGAPCSTLRWAKRFGDASEQTGRAIAFDPAGDVVVTGQFEGVLDFGAGALSAPAPAVFVAKLDGANGAPRWSRQFGNAGESAGTGVAIDAAGDIFVAGVANAPIDFGGGPICVGPFNQTFLVELDPQGVHRFSRCFGDSANGTGNWATVALDSQGRPVLVGTNYGTIDFGTGSLSSTDGQAFVAKFDVTGAALWAQPFGGFDGMGWGVAIDASDDILLAGTFRNVITTAGASFDGGDYGAGLVLELTADGAARWARAFHAASMYDSPLNVFLTIAPDGHVDVTGAPFSAIDFGDGQLEPAAGIVAALDSAGALAWTAAPGGGIEGGPAVVDANGRVLVLTNLNDPDDGANVGLGAFDASGAPLFSTVFGPAGGQALALHDGRLAMLGIAGYPIDMGGGPLVGAGDDSDVLVAVWTP